MSEALRGSRLGATSYENDVNVELAPRLMTTYDCPEGHATTLPFSVEAEVPFYWECPECGSEALLRGGIQPERKEVKAPRSHWDMLLERRSIDDLEELLTERLALLRPVTTAPDVRRSA